MVYQDQNECVSITPKLSRELVGSIAGWFRKARLILKKVGVLVRVLTTSLRHDGGTLWLRGCFLSPLACATRPRQNDLYFADDISKRIAINDFFIMMWIPLNLLLRVQMTIKQRGHKRTCDGQLHSAVPDCSTNHSMADCIVVNGYNYFCAISNHWPSRLNAIFSEKKRRLRPHYQC